MMHRADMRLLFWLGVDRYNVMGRDAYVEKYPFEGDRFAAKAYLGGVKCAERKQPYNRELNEVLK